MFSCLLKSSAILFISSAFVFASQATIKLDKTAQDFLAKKSLFTMCVDPHFMPYEHINRLGQHEGIFADFLTLIAGKAAIQFKLVTTQNYGQSRSYFEDGKCDLIAGDQKPVSEVDYLSSKTYFIAESGFAVRVSEPDHLNFASIAAGKTGYIEGADMSVVKKNYPDINLISVSSDLDGLRKVASGELDSYLSTMATIDYTIRNHGITQLKLGGKINDQVNFAILVSMTNAPLVPVLDKAIDDISSLERQTITGRWFAQTQKPTVSHTVLWTLFVITFVILLYFFYRYLAQKRRNVTLEHTVMNTEQALISSENRFRALVESSPDWAWQVDANAVYTYASPRIKDLLGYDVDEVIGKTPFDLMSPEESNRIKKIFSDIASNKRSFHNLENINLHKNGHAVILETSGVPIIGPEGELLGYQGIDRDITERKRLQLELQQANKMESLGQLTGGIAHDFNNLLSIISGYAELGLLNVRKKNDHQLGEYLEHIKQAGKRAAALVSQMLTFSRRGQPNAAGINIASLLKEDVKLIRATLPSTIEIHADIDETLPDVILDPVELQQIIMNLAVNARDAMEGKGELNIKLGWAKNLNAISLISFEPLKGDWVDLSVSDSGAGIASDIVKHIFDPFFTTKDVGKGTGMGLSVVYGIVKSYSGHILVDSTPGKGTNFRILFPPINRPTRNSTQSELPIETKNKGNKENILFVDDEEGIVNYMRVILEKHNYVTTAVSNSRKALSLFKSDPYRYAIIISDQTMPNITGIELIQEARKIRPDLPAILCSGYSEQIDANGAQEKNVQYFSKPFDIDNLMTCISNLVSISKRQPSVRSIEADNLDH